MKKTIRLKHTQAVFMKWRRKFKSIPLAIIVRGPDNFNSKRSAL